MPPLTLLIKPASGRCNMRCRYCFYGDVTARRAVPDYGVMTADTQEIMLRRAFAYADGCLSLSFQGGEPTLAGKDYFHRLAALEKKFGSRRIPVQRAIQTNGLLLDDEWAALLAEGHYLVGVSLDGSRALNDLCRVDQAGHSTYDRVMRGIAALERHHVEYNILCVVNRFNALKPRETWEALSGYRYLQFIPCLDDFDGQAADYSLRPAEYGAFLIETFDLYERAWRAGAPVSVRAFDNWLGMLLGRQPENCAMCGRCGNYFVIEADGGAYPCDFYVLDEWRAGNIREDSFMKMERSPRVAAFRAASVPLPDNCPRCPWLPLCRGGCRRDREPFTDGKPSQNRLCPAFTMFFEARAGQMRRLAEYIAAQPLRKDT